MAKEDRAHQLSAARLFWARFLLYTFLGIYFLWANPFGMGDATDKASQDALYRLFAPWYGTDAQDEIVVVLVDDHAIDQLYQRHFTGANEWPLLYRDHGAILERIMAFRPRAVFMDISFEKERSTDESLPAMIRRLQRAKQRYGTKLFFASGYADGVRSPIQGKLAAVGTLVSSGWQGFGRSYPLFYLGRNMPAYELYRVACLGSDPRPGCARPLLRDVKEGKAMSVLWGSEVPSVPFPRYVKTSCGRRPTDFLSRLIGFVEAVGRGLVGDTGDDSGRCPFHRVLYVHTLVHIARQGSEEERNRLRALLKDRIVLVGLSLEGLHDIVTSPVHGQLPGVMLHAMALDNLIAHGADYVKASDEVVEWIGYGTWCVLVLLASLVLYRLERWQERSSMACHAGTPGTGGSTGSVTRGTARWLRSHPRTVIYSIAALVVIGLSLVMFFGFRYEPLNSLAFAGLSMLMIEMIREDRAQGFIDWLTGIRDFMWKTIGATLRFPAMVWQLMAKARGSDD